MENTKAEVCNQNREENDEEKEIADALSAGGKVISLGARILRTETAAITSVAMCMLHCEMEL